MGGISFNPIHYVLAGVCLLLVIVSGAYWFQGQQYQLTKARFEAFVAETKAVGVIADRDGRLKNAKYQQHKKESDHEIELARNSLLAFADSLRKSATGARSSLLPTPAPSAGNPERTDYDRSYLVTTFEDFTREMGEIRREATELIIEGATAESGLNGAKTWAQGVHMDGNEQRNYKQ